MGIPGSANPLLLASAEDTGYQVSRSLRFNSSDSAYLSRTPASASDRKTWTWAGWVKLAVLADEFGCIFDAGSGGVNNNFRFDPSTGKLSFRQFDGSTTLVLLETTQVFRDYSAWYHIVLAYDSTQATSSNRVKLYVNGSQVTAFDTATYPSLNLNAYVNSTNEHRIGTSVNNANTRHFDGYLADIHLIDGQALTPSSFTEVDATTGQLIPKAYTGSYGTNGFHLPFSDNSTAAALGTDTSGNSNTWTVNNISVAAGAGNDSLVDTPTSYGTDTGAGGEVRGNYCTLNPVVGGPNISQITFANGNLEATWSTGANYAVTLGTIGVNSGKWYWETTIAGSSNFWLFGIATSAITLNNYIGQEAVSYGYYSVNGQTYNANNSLSYGSSYTTNDIIGVALDLDNGRLFFSKNGVWQNSGNPVNGTNAAYTGLSGTFFPAYAEGTSGAATAYICNFGQRPFAYAAPSGFKALCDTNLPAPVVAKPNTVMDVLTWVGNNTNNRAITGLNFSPDFIWIKNRTNASENSLFDAVRGAAKTLYSNQTAAELSSSAYGHVSSFDSAGFTLANGSDATYPNLATNYLNSNIVAWTWDAGTSTVTNTQGSITSQVRANPSAGFSIVTFTCPSSGAYSFGHGLSVAPSMVIMKDRGGSTNWIVYHSAVTSSSEYLILNGTNAKLTASGIWGAGITTTVVGSTANVGINPSNNAVAYCFAPVAGYSSFGVVTATGTSDGGFAYTGFRPRFLLYKNASGTGNWGIYDSARDPENVCDNLLLPSASNAEFTSVEFDFLSNGIKLRYPYTNGHQIVFAAFAEAPFQYARAR